MTTLINENTYDDREIAGRELPSGINTPELLAEHYTITNGKVRTRFPPEPNGYLHIGHAKSMNMNFSLAFEKLGVPEENRQTYFRYDDTNPEAESNEYIVSLREDVNWLGHKPNPITFTSNYFNELHDFAIKLIKDGKAYVCHQTKADIETSREICRANILNPDNKKDPNSPWRDRPIEESLRLFKDMRNGKFSASEATLRLKMDMTSPNPNMWDQVAYRIKYVAHPHAGDDWCIYPTYDYTHCIIDSLEHIDYSICTLEFETRRESYFWVLEALNLYRPKVYEMSRLNMSYTLLSKRKLLKLVTNGYMRGWTDPRMPTIKGLKRRGYTPQIINDFCKDIGATRNANTVQYDRLASIARSNLHESSPRVMGLIKPLKVLISGRPKDVSNLDIPDFPFDVTRGSHNITIEDEIYIDMVDFRMIDDNDYYGLAPNKVVSLKYAFRIRCNKVDTNAAGEPVLLHCSYYEGEDKAKTAIQWVPASTCVNIEVRMYDHLFLIEEPTDAGWEKELNPNSEEVCPNALVDESFLKLYSNSVTHFQFERIGFFTIDPDTVIDYNNLKKSKFVCNLVVNLKDSKPKVAGAPTKSRKEEQDRLAAEKLAKANIAPEEIFKSQTDLYSLFDEKGIPTHDNKGEKISKSGIKKLVKDWEKQKKLFESSK